MSRAESDASETLDLGRADRPLVVVVGAGGVGKTTLAASMGVASAAAGIRSLVMTFDPSLRLKDALGVRDAPTDEEVEVPGSDGELFAALLDARKTFDRLVTRYTPEPEARRRILENPYYDHLAGRLGGILEYMAVERLYEVAKEGHYERIFLDTPPTAQALDFLEAPSRVAKFLDSGALKIALKPWFDDGGRLKLGRRMSFVGKGIEGFLDKIVGLDLLRDMSEFFRAFEPMFHGFRGRAEKVEALLKSPDTLFVLVTGPGESRIADTLFFARKLKEKGHRLGPIIVNRMHPEVDGSALVDGPAATGGALLEWLGQGHRNGFDELRRLLPPTQQLIALPVEPDEPTDLRGLGALGEALNRKLVS